MAIRRIKLPFEEQYVQIPNSWMRDPRLSRRARGLLAEIMTHQTGWVISVNSLWQNGPEGREAIRKTIVELADAGYLQRDQSHGDRGRFGEMNYVLSAPELSTVSEDSTVAQKLGDGSVTGARSTVAQDPATKKTISKEDHLKGGADAPAPTPDPSPFCARHRATEGTDKPCAACKKARIAWEGPLIAAARDQQWEAKPEPRYDPAVYCGHLQLIGKCWMCDDEAKRGDLEQAHA
jgi:hypothetical protein